MQYYGRQGYEAGNVDCTLRVRLPVYSAKTGARLGLIFWGDNKGEYKDIVVKRVADSPAAGFGRIRKP